MSGEGLRAAGFVVRGVSPALSRYRDLPPLSFAYSLRITDRQWSPKVSGVNGPPFPDSRDTGMRSFDVQFTSTKSFHFSFNVIFSSFMTAVCTFFL